MLQALAQSVPPPLILPTHMQGQYSDVFPMLVMTVLSVMGGVVSLSLPETLNQPLPETLAELEVK